MVRPHELECFHGIGHQLGSHGCDGCCGRIFGGLVEQERERIIKLLEKFWILNNKQLPYYDELIALIKGEK